MSEQRKRNLPRLVSLVTTDCWFTFLLFELSRKAWHFEYLDDCFCVLYFTAVISGASYLLTLVTIRHREAPPMSENRLRRVHLSTALFLMLVGALLLLPYGEDLYYTYGLRFARAGSVDFESPLRDRLWRGIACETTIYITGILILGALFEYLVRRREAHRQ